MPFVGASPPSTLWILEHTLTHRHKYGTVCTQWCTQTHYHMQTNARLHTSSLIYTHVPPPPCDSSNTRTHTHTLKRTQSTPTTHGWWTTSAYPSLRPCPWRGCWLASGFSATMSSCLPFCHPLQKCVVTISFFSSSFTQTLSLTSPWTSGSSMHSGLIKWSSVIFWLLESFPWIRTRLYMMMV